MSVKIKVSYTDEAEMLKIVELLKPIMDGFKVKNTTGTPPYKHLYFMPRKAGKH